MIERNPTLMQLTSKLLFTLLVSLSQVFLVHAQEIGTSFLIPEYDRAEMAEYDKDAARLALIHDAGGEKLTDIGIEISENIRKSIFNALIAINQSSVPEAKKVTTELNIHTRQKPYYIGEFIVVCSKETSWTRPLKKGNPQIANEEVNRLIEKHKLSISNYNEDNNSFVVSAYPYLNVSVLASKFSRISGVDMIELPEVGQSEHDIFAKYLGHQSWELTFVKYNSNQVTREQEAEEKWSFRVESDGKVSYIPRP